MSPFSIVEVPSGVADLPEQLGTKYKFWYRSASDQPYLFKEGRPGTGENWAEKIAAELCKLLGIPAAEYDLATFEGRRGVVTPSFVPRRGRLVFGNELLSHFIRGYDEAQVYRPREYKLRNVLRVLGVQNFVPPIAFEGTPQIVTALDVFVGYLMLDAWIANQDRHHENWGLILTQERTIHLAPTFDHASSLGRNESDRTREEMLTTKDQGRSVAHYVERARSAFFPTTSVSGETRPLRPMTTLEAFGEAARIRPRAAHEWRERLSAVPRAEIETLFSRIPKDWISGPAVRFSLRMLELNRIRILG